MKILINNSYAQCLTKSVKALVYATALATLIGCQSEIQGTTSTSALTSDEHHQLLQKAKSAVLSSDFSQADMLTSKIDVNQLLPDQSSLLAWAVEAQNPAMVSMLLKKGAKTSLENENRFSPVILACLYGNAEIINALLEHGANPNSSVEDGTSAFQLCAGSAATPVLVNMVSQGANIAAINSDGQTAMMFAANEGNAENLQYLADLGADINQQTLEGYSPLFFAIKSHDLDTVKTAIQLGADLFASAVDGTTAPQLAVYTGNYTFLTWYARQLDTLMSEENVNNVLTAYDRDGYQLLHAAVKANQPQLVTALLELGADPTTMSEPSKLTWRYEANFKSENYIPPQLTPIEIAVKNEFTEIAALLSSEGVTPTSI